VAVAKGAAAPRLDLTRENLAETLSRFERDGLAGAIRVKFDAASEPFERYFGVANAALGTMVQRDTIFAIGSFPIEFTVASALLLEQRGLLSVDDPVARFIADVPSDKKAMTLRHLMTGQSGLPDFFHEASDWDKDLAWIDRVTAERRILGKTLLFAPGTERRHSHAAYGRRAAIVERLAKEPYETFVRRNILEPAGMTRTGFNGEHLGLKLEDFAVGRGSSSTGLPNIPPNWGPASWLVMGSGGMFSTLGDLERFHAAMRSDRILTSPRSDRFKRAVQSQDGNDNGFELFHAYNPAGGGEVTILVNVSGLDGNRRQLFDGLARLVGMGGR
jgi:CubicO group peptidase (beta-lactamase class C family)